MPKKSKETLPKESASDWWRSRIEEMERAHAQRVKLLRSVGEHPSPIFAKQVKMFGGLGLPKPLVAKLLGLRGDMLDMHYGDEYDLGAAEIMAGVAANMIRIATSTEDPNAAKIGMEFLSRRGGQEWRPAAQKIELKDDREKPKNVIDSSRLTYEQRLELRRMIEHVEGGGKGEPLRPEEDQAG
jgi:hypothetical protein